MVCGIVSGIWLAILGEWEMIGYGIVILFSSIIILGIAMLLGMMFVIPVAKLYEKGHKSAVILLAFMRNLYIISVLTLWCLCILIWYVSKSNVHSMAPLILWSYGIATGPIAWMAHRDWKTARNECAMILAFSAQIAYILSMMHMLYFHVKILNVIILFWGVMFFGLIIQWKIAFQIDKGGEWNH